MWSVQICNQFDVILGADFLRKTRIDVKYSKNTVEWSNSELPLRNLSTLNNEDYSALAEKIEGQQEPEYFGMDWFEPYAMQLEYWMQIYEQIDINGVVEQLDHLNNLKRRFKISA